MSAIQVLTKAKSLGISLWVQDGALKYKAPSGSLNEELRAEILAERENLIRFLDTAPIPPRSDDDASPLSYGQKWLWIMNQIDKDSSEFNIPSALTMKGTLDFDALRESFRRILARHEILRTKYRSVDAEVRLEVVDEPVVDLPVADISQLSEKEQEQRVFAEFQAEMDNSFDLETGILFRSRLLKLSPTKHVLILGFHHIICDNQSFNIFLGELFGQYSGIVDSTPVQWPPLSIQYADFAAWQNQRLADYVKDKQLAYWRTKLGNMQGVPDIEGDYARPEEISHKSIRRNYLLPGDVTAKLKALSQKAGCSLYVTLLSVLQVLLHQYSGNREFVIGTPVAGRGRSELEPLIGLFFNTVAIRNRLDPGQKFGQLLATVKTTSTEAMLHQEIPFGMLVDELKPPRQPNKTPFFQVLFNMYSAKYEGRLPGLEISPFHQDIIGGQNINSKFDITLLAIEHEAGLQLDFSFKADLYAPETVSWLVDHFQALTRAVCDAGDPVLQSLPVLAPLPSHAVQISQPWQTVPVADTESTITARWEAQARRFFTKTAVADSAGATTYGQLVTCVDGINAAVRSGLAGAPPSVVGLLLGHTTQQVAAMLGTLKSGHAFVSLDPEYPADRLAYILHDTRAALVLCCDQTEALAQSLIGQAKSSAAVLNLSNPESLNAADPVDHAQPDDLAYVIYTSGSSGNPKGVMQTHRNALHFTRNYTNGLHIGAEDKLSLIPSFSFSAAMMDVFAALTNGAQLTLYHLKAEGLDRLGPWLVEQGITIYHSVPTVFRHFVAQMPPGLSFPALRIIDFGGESVTAQDVHLYRKHFERTCILVNGLGATELNVIRQYPVDHDTVLTTTKVPVGYAVEGTEILLVDEAGHRVGYNHPGEIQIRSRYLSPGYWNLAEETDRAFRLDGEGPERIYRTGDLGRLRPDGCLEHLGRRDLQIKINGVRIEPGEIEAALLERPGIREAVVTGAARTAGDVVLAAYLVVDAPGEFSTGQLRTSLLEVLPSSMIPAEFVLLDALPLTSTGKIDRRALPALGGSGAPKSSGDEAPRNSTEALLAQIWREVFHRDDVGIHANFFELGGDSLLSMQVIAKAKQSGVHLSARQFFQHQTIAGLASVAKTSSAVFAQQDLVTGPVLLTNGQNWFFGNDQFVDPDRWNQRCIVEVSRPIPPELARGVVEQFVSHHDALRIRFSHDNGVWTQDIPVAMDEVPFNHIDLSGVPAALQPATVQEQANRWLNSLSLTAGPLFRVVYFDLGTQANGRILVIVHRVIADTTSFRIMLEDLQRAFGQALQGQPVQFPPKTSSFQYWSERLNAYAHSPELRTELETYWKKLPWDELQALPVDFPENRDRASRNSFRSVTRMLTAEETDKLLTDVSAKHNTQAVDALLTALTKTVGSWSGGEHIMANIFNSLRTGMALPDSEKIDISRTVGHVVGTSIIFLEARRGSSVVDALKSIQKQRAELPNLGTGYNFLEYLTYTPESWPLVNTRKNQLMFSYMGRPDEEAGSAGSSLFSWGKEVLEPELDPQNKFWHLLEVITFLQDGQMVANWRFSGDLYKTETIEQLAAEFMDVLRDLIAS